MPRNLPDQPYEYETEPERPGPQPLDWVKLLLRSAMRRKIMFLAVFVAGAAAVFGYYKWKRPVYRVEAKIFAQRQPVLPSGMRSGTEDAPSRTAWELVHRRENLISLIKAADLMRDVVDQRAFKEKLRPDREDPLDRMVKTLDKRLVVLPEEGTVTLQLDWPDPQQAYRVVDGALQNFIEARHVQEVTAIDDVISVLRAREAKAKENLDRVTDDVRRETVEGVRAAATATPVTPTPRPGGRGPSEELVRLKSLLDAKARAIEDVDEFRRRRLADLHAQLDEKQHTYSDAHPAVIQLKQDIDALSKESSQVEGLRAEEARLRKDYQTRLAQEGASDTGARDAAPSRTPPAALPAVRYRNSQTPIEDDERVRDARFQYQQVAGLVNQAQLELDAIRAAFKYRYNIIWPPQVPTDPISPNPIKIFGLGILGAFLFALLAAAAPDLRAGRIIERWQVERGLELPILGEVVVRK
jgi:hypothetical protein